MLSEWGGAVYTTPCKGSTKNTLMINFKNILKIVNKHD